MFGTHLPDAERDAALARVDAWVRERFGLRREDAVMVTELACEVSGCPPLETVIAFWTGGGLRHHYKVFKPVRQVSPDDLPPYWMKDALAVPSDRACDCC